MRGPNPKYPHLVLEHFLPYRLNVLASSVSEALARVYASYGISIPGWRVLATLGEAQSATATDIACQTHMHKTKVSRAVADLIRLGFVVRTVNSNDAREAFLALSQEGRAIYGKLIPIAQNFVSHLTAEFSALEMQAIDALVTRLTARGKALGSHDDWLKDLQ